MRTDRIRKIVLCAVTLLSFMGCIGTGAVAEEDHQVNYAVRALLPRNQRNLEVSYFDLKMEPGQEQVLQVLVKNKGDKDIEVAVEANTAFSNGNGVIEFSHTEERDPSMVVDFSQIAAPTEPVMKISANSEAIAEIFVRMPEEPYEGVVYGGLMFTKLNQGAEIEAESGMSIRNEYRYVLGVRLWESEEEVEPAFELMSAEVGQTRQPSILLNLRNPRPVIARGITMKVEIYPQGSGDATVTLSREQLGMAPNTWMPYALFLGHDTELSAGEYRVNVTLELEGQSWVLETPLVVD